MKVRLSKAKKPPVLSQIRFSATSKNLAGFAQKKVADDDKRFLQKKVIPVKLFYVIDGLSLFPSMVLFSDKMVDFYT